MACGLSRQPYSPTVFFLPTAEAKSTGRGSLRVIEADGRAFLKGIGSSGSSGSSGRSGSGSGRGNDREGGGGDGGGGVDGGPYDIIFIDAYAHGIPRPLRTVEFMKLVHGSLRPGGVVASNIDLSSSQGRITHSYSRLVATAVDVFGSSNVHVIDLGNSKVLFARMPLLMPLARGGNNTAGGGDDGNARAAGAAGAAGAARATGATGVVGNGKGKRVDREKLSAACAKVAAARAFPGLGVDVMVGQKFSSALCTDQRARPYKDAGNRLFRVNRLLVINGRGRTKTQVK